MNRAHRVRLYEINHSPRFRFVGDAGGDGGAGFVRQRCVTRPRGEELAELRDVGALQNGAAEVGVHVGGFGDREPAFVALTRAATEEASDCAAGAFL